MSKSNLAAERFKALRFGISGLHSLGKSGFELGLHYCQLPVADEVQPDRNSYPAVLTVVWIVFDSHYMLLYSQESMRQQFEPRTDFIHALQS